ncbi:hypothetical protein RFI_22632 [Reticulomyxa filosa]|uniref:Uncharacterized protein n=1 Tax=Reticulomyxa filosa TaxID=46433 RepID=X6MMS0_RETFI|nr:hypothetical protein RFI_22632 [Reticulomyxa filosa]|eukprot:ETO14737.1 hypothetical protein RFI_22632 [Reticulomyxa filosa]
MSRDSEMLKNQSTLNSHNRNKTPEPVYYRQFGGVTRTGTNTITATGTGTGTGTTKDTGLTFGYSHVGTVFTSPSNPAGDLVHPPMTDQNSGKKPLQQVSSLHLPSAKLQKNIELMDKDEHLQLAHKHYLASEDFDQENSQSHSIGRLERNQPNDARNPNKSKAAADKERRKEDEAEYSDASNQSNAFQKKNGLQETRCIRRRFYKKKKKKKRAYENDNEEEENNNNEKEEKKSQNDEMQRGRKTRSSHIDSDSDSGSIHTDKQDDPHHMRTQSKGKQKDRSKSKSKSKNKKKSKKNEHRKDNGKAKTSATVSDNDTHGKQSKAKEGTENREDDGTNEKKMAPQTDDMERYDSRNLTDTLSPQ